MQEDRESTNSHPAAAGGQGEGTEAKRTPKGNRGSREVKQKETTDFLSRSFAKIRNPNHALDRSYKKQLGDKKFQFMNELHQIRHKKKEDSVSSHDGGTDDEDFSLGQAARKRGRKGQEASKKGKKMASKGKPVKKTPKDESDQQEEARQKPNRKKPTRRQSVRTTGKRKPPTKKKESSQSESSDDEQSGKQGEVAAKKQIITNKKQTARRSESSQTQSLKGQDNRPIEVNTESIKEQPSPPASKEQVVKVESELESESSHQKETPAKEIIPPVRASDEIIEIAGGNKPAQTAKISPKRKNMARKRGNLKTSKPKAKEPSEQSIPQQSEEPSKYSTPQEQKKAVISLETPPAKTSIATGTLGTRRSTRLQQDPHPTTAVPIRRRNISKKPPTKSTSKGKDEMQVEEDQQGCQDSNKGKDESAGKKANNTHQQPAAKCISQKISKSFPFPKDSSSASCSHRQRKMDRLALDSKVVLESLLFFDSRADDGLPRRKKGKKRHYIIESDSDGDLPEAYLRRRPNKSKRYRKILVEESEDDGEPDERGTKVIRVAKRTAEGQPVRKAWPREKSQESGSGQQRQSVMEKRLGKEETQVESKPLR